MADYMSVTTVDQIVDNAIGKNVKDDDIVSTGDHTQDTLSLARQVRQNQGPWETEISFRGEGDLYEHFKECKKNEGHKNFIPVGQFDLEHLPSGCKDPSIVDLTRAMSDLTVRVAVKHVSDARPETFNGIPYPKYKNSGESMLRVGTGWMDRVDKYLTKDLKICPCQECKKSSAPKSEFAEIFVHTASHVVYDSEEAEHTTCNLFYDKGENLKQCPSAINLSGWSVVLKNIDRDVSLLRHVTHDLELADKLDKMVNCYNSRWRVILDKFNIRSDTSPTPRLDLFNVMNLIIIVSHPHGTSKKVSVGFCTNTKPYFIDQTDLQHKYTTATCPGCSGALVRLKSDSNMTNFYYLLHCGYYEEDTQFNYCY